MKRATSAIALAVAVAAAAGAAFAQQPATAPEGDVLQAKCTLCHSSQRFLSADPARVKELVERMTRKNPEWFKDTNQDVLAAGLAKILSDPQIAVRRTAWDDTVAKGKAFFADASFGTTGKSCASCHKVEGLRGIAERYPEYDAKLGRHVSLQERLQIMIRTKLGGKDLPLGDIRTVALEAYLKSIP